jgi:tetraacyldisaccharide 4'-kinase
MSGLLAPLGAAYGVAAGARLRQRGRDAGVPVLCVGNPTLGGAGKTPAAIAVARLLDAAGRRPFLLSRGHGGALAGPVQVDPARHKSDDVGDEPLLLARVAPTVVARDRVAGAEFARATGAGVIVMDDGFQNPGLRKDRSLLVVDGSRGVGNGRVFPAGPLRAPLAAQLRRAEAVLVVGGGEAGDRVAGEAQGYSLAVFRGRLEPDAAALAALRGRPVLAFAGIGDPGKFFATLRGSGIEIGASVGFPDHHRYRRHEARDLIERAERAGMTLVTTEKDMARMAGQNDVAALAGVARELPVTLQVAEEAAFGDWVLA